MEIAWLADDLRFGTNLLNGYHYYDIIIYDGV